MTAKRKLVLAKRGHLGCEVCGFDFASTYGKLDRDKAQRNLKKHGVSFDEATTVFYDLFSATFDDPAHSVREPRLITIGYSSRERLLVVSHTERADAIRIISARRATRQEKKRHETQEPETRG